MRNNTPNNEPAKKITEEMAMLSDDEKKARILSIYSQFLTATKEEKPKLAEMLLEIQHQGVIPPETEDALKKYFAENATDTKNTFASFSMDNALQTEDASKKAKAAAAAIKTTEETLAKDQEKFELSNKKRLEETAIAMLMEEIANAKNELTPAEEKLAEAQRNLENCKEIEENCRKEANNAQLNEKTLETDIVKIQDNIAQLSVEITLAKTNYDIALSQLKNITEKVSATESQLAIFQNSASTPNTLERIKTLQKELEDLKKLQKTAHTEVGSTLNQLTQKTTHKEEAENILKVKTASLTDAKALTLKTEIAVKQAEAKRLEAEKMLTTNQEIVAKIESRIRKAESTVQTLTEKKDALAASSKNIVRNKKQAGAIADGGQTSANGTRTEEKASFEETASERLSFQQHTPSPERW